MKKFKRLGKKWMTDGRKVTPDTGEDIVAVLLDESGGFFDLADGNLGVVVVQIHRHLFRRRLDGLSAFGDVFQEAQVAPRVGEGDFSRRAGRVPGQIADLRLLLVLEGKDDGLGPDVEDEHVAGLGRGGQELAAGRPAADGHVFEPGVRQLGPFLPSRASVEQLDGGGGEGRHGQVAPGRRLELSPAEGRRVAEIVALGPPRPALDLLAGRERPEADGSVAAARGEEFGFGVEAQAEDGRLVALQDQIAVLALQVAHFDGHVPGSRPKRC